MKFRELLKFSHSREPLWILAFSLLPLILGLAIVFLVAFFGGGR